MQPNQKSNEFQRPDTAARPQYIGWSHFGRNVHKYFSGFLAQFCK